MYSNKLILSIIVVAGISLQAAPADSSSAPSSDSSAVSEGAQSPSFALPDMSGETVFLRDFCGEKLRKSWKNKTKHVVVLSFFASWCAPCKKEIPILHEVVAGFKDKPLKTFLINEQDKKPDVKKIISDAGYTLPVLLDMYGITAKNYGLVNDQDAIALPRLFVIDKKGTIRMINRGFKDSEEDFRSSLTALLNDLLAE